MMLLKKSTRQLLVNTRSYINQKSLWVPWPEISITDLLTKKRRKPKVKWESIYVCVYMSAVWSITKSWETKLIPEDSSSREVVLNQGQFSHQRIFCHLWRQFWLLTPGDGDAPGTWWVETKGPTEVPYSAQGSSDKKELSSLEYLV